MRRCSPLKARSRSTKVGEAGTRTTVCIRLNFRRNNNNNNNTSNMKRKTGRSGSSCELATQYVGGIFRGLMGGLQSMSRAS